MVRRHNFINKIRGAGYEFKTERKRIYLYRKGVHFIAVPKAELLEDSFVVNALRQAGLEENEIQTFLGSVKT